jgi:type VI secretion system protein VasG
MTDPDEFTKAVFPELLKTFKPAFLGRLSIIPFYPLDDEVMSSIIRLKLGKVAARVSESYKADFSYTDAVVETILSRCTEVDTGARNVDHILNRTLLPELSAQVLSDLADGKSIGRITVDVKDDGFHHVVGE